MFPGGAKLLSTGSGGMSGMSAGVTRNEVIAAIGVMLAACVATATAVHRLDQGETEARLMSAEARSYAEIKRVQGEAEARLMSAETRLMSADAEIKRVQGEAEARLMSADAEVKRIEGERALAESMWRNEIEHYKREVQLFYTHDYEPYKEAKEKNREKMKKMKKMKKNRGGEEEDETEKEEESGVKTK